jgi:wobble nucleotide-excising tRNase
MENLEKKPVAIDASITNRIQEIEERISGAEDTTENIDTTIKENAKWIKVLTQNIQEISQLFGEPRKAPLVFAVLWKSYGRSSLRPDLISN